MLNQRTKFVSRLDRLDQHLVKDCNFDHEVKEVPPEVWLPFFKDDAPIILDLSDLNLPNKLQLHIASASLSNVTANLPFVSLR